MKNVLYIIKVVALACAAGVIMTILGAFPPLSFLYNWLVGHGLQNVWTNQKSRGSLIPRLFLRVYRLLMNFSIRSNPSFRSASE